MRTVMRESIWKPFCARVSLYGGIGWSVARNSWRRSCAELEPGVQPPPPTILVGPGPRQPLSPLRLEGWPCHRLGRKWPGRS